MKSIRKKGLYFKQRFWQVLWLQKKTADLIPLCHPLALNRCDVDIVLNENKAEVTCTVGCSGKTGVEMEALTGASVAALTIYDMCKAFSHDIVIESTRLKRKTGGKSDFG